ncbi:MAG: O-antigen ligase family protein, partial [Chloroflexota bacterium]
PYGFNTPPDNRTVREDTLNFSRIVALREIMVQHGDGAKALWASAWGWNSLPADWSGTPSIWGGVTSDQRVSDTLAGLDRADREWPWLGGMILQQWQPAVPTTDPQWGFALVDPQDNPTPLWTALAQREQSSTATSGLYFPANPFARYSGVWTFGDLGADIGWVQDSQLDFSYTGSDLALRVRQDNYVAFLYATVDGQPANTLPRDASGNAILNLTSDTRLPETNLVPIAHGLGTGQHILHIAADRGWDRWALAGFAVSSGNLADPYNRQIAVALLTAVISTLAAAVTALRFDWSPLRRQSSGLWERLGDAGQIAVSVIASLALMIGMLLTWSDAVPNLFRREPVQFGLAILSAGLVYVQPHIVVTLIALIVLFLIVYHRLDLGLMLTVFYAPFFLFPIALYKFSFPMSELVILITTAAWILRSLAAWGRIRQSGAHQFAPLSLRSHFTPLDYGVGALVVLGALSLTWAEQRGAALTEWRTLLLEPALFYLILRTSARARLTLLRLIDTLLIAGMVVAVIGLFQFVNGQAIITAEEGARRLASVYGSPNNVGLFLGRCIPFLLAFALVRVDLRRRIFAGVGLIILLIAAALTQSAGALFLGIPAAVTAVLLLIYGRRGLLALLGLAAVGLGGFALALRSERFAHVLDFSEGTNFFRIRVWTSALEMIHDHPITGLGLDQFLYAYRGRYILPDAWQEPNLSHPHNFFLDFWVRLGIFGVIIFLWMQVFFWKRAAQLYRSFKSRDPLMFALVVGIVGSMINLLAHGLVDNSVFVNDLSYVFVLLLGLISNIRAIDDNPETMV